MLVKDCKARLLPEATTQPLAITIEENTLQRLLSCNEGSAELLFSPLSIVSARRRRFLTPLNWRRSALAPRLERYPLSGRTDDVWGDALARICGSLNSSRDICIRSVRTA